MQWQKQDVSAEQFQADEQECRQSAWREASAEELARKDAERRSAHGCMAAEAATELGT